MSVDFDCHASFGGGGRREGGGHMLGPNGRLKLSKSLLGILGENSVVCRLKTLPDRGTP